MNHRGLTLGIVLALAIGIGIWTSWPDLGGITPPPPAPPPTTVAAAATAAAAATSAAIAAPDSATAANPTITEPERIAAPAASAPRPLTVIRGRCVDEHGAPIAGCRVGIHGWGANSERMDA